MRTDWIHVQTSARPGSSNQYPSRRGTGDCVVGMLLSLILTGLISSDIVTIVVIIIIIIIDNNIVNNISIAVSFITDIIDIVIQYRV